MDSLSPSLLQETVSARPHIFLVDPSSPLSLYSAALYLMAGASTGLAALASGYAIGVVGEAGVRAYMQQTKLYIGMVVILIFSEVLSLYGLIISIMMIAAAKNVNSLCQ